MEEGGGVTTQHRGTFRLPNVGPADMGTLADNAFQLISEARKANRTPAVLLMSGYTAEAIVMEMNGGWWPVDTAESRMWGYHVVFVDTMQPGEIAIGYEYPRDAMGPE